MYMLKTNRTAGGLRAHFAMQKVVGRRMQAHAACSKEQRAWSKELEVWKYELGLWGSEWPRARIASAY